MNYKKIIFLILFGCIFLTACGNKYKNFEHYDLRKLNINDYTFHYDNRDDTYAVADITNIKNDMGGIVGLFYKISDDDYILLDEIESCGNTDSDYILSNVANYFYQRKGNNQAKLYTSRCLGANLLYEYTLEKEKISKKQLEFDYSDITKGTDTINSSRILNVDDDYIYLDVSLNSARTQVNIKCDFNSMKCSETS